MLQCRQCLTAYRSSARSARLVPALQARDFLRPASAVLMISVCSRNPPISLSCTKALTSAWSGAAFCLPTRRAEFSSDAIWAVVVRGLDWGRLLSYVRHLVILSILAIGEDCESGGECELAAAFLFFALAVGQPPRELGPSRAIFASSYVMTELIETVDKTGPAAAHLDRTRNNTVSEQMLRSPVGSVELFA